MKLKFSFLLMTISLFIACAKSGIVQDGTNGGNDGSGGLQFKDSAGNYQTIYASDVKFVDVTIFNNATSSSIQKKLTDSLAQEIVTTFGFNNPTFVDVEKMELTGKVIVSYQFSGSPYGQIRTFNIYNYKYVEDATFRETIYKSKKILTEEWLTKETM